MKALFLLILSLTTTLFAVTSPILPLESLTLPSPNGYLQLAVSSNSRNAIAVWTNFPNHVEVQGAYLNGTSWVNDLEENPPLNHFLPITIGLGSSPKVGIDGGGIATIVWVTPNNGIYVARYEQLDNGLVGLIDSQSQLLTRPGTNNSSPTMAVSEDGTVIIVWIQAVPYNILCSSLISVPGATWSNPQQFMVIPRPGIFPNNVAGIPANSAGTYPAQIGLWNKISLNGVTVNQGFIIWTDGASGEVNTGSFSVP